MKIGATVTPIQTRGEPSDPLVARWRELKAQRVAIDAEMRSLKERMKYGVCEHCGASFTRIRPTKRHCSARCLSLAYQAREVGHARAFDVLLIRRALPAIEAAGLMTPRALNVVRDLVSDDPVWNTNQLAERTGVSHQRISQIAARAHKFAKLVMLVRGTDLGESAADREIQEAPASVSSR